MENKELSPELRDEITNKASALVNARNYNNPGWNAGFYEGYETGATKYASKWQQSEAQNKQLREALEEMKEVMEWMWDNCRLQEGKEYLQSDLFNRPANAIEQANTVLDSRKEVENG